MKLLPLLLLLLSGCAMTPGRMDALWASTAAEYNYTGPQPRVYVIEGLNWYGKPLHGLFYKDRNVILINPDDISWLDTEALEHEYRHVCGDTLGEKPIK